MQQGIDMGPLCGELSLTVNVTWLSLLRRKRRFCSGLREAPPFHIQLVAELARHPVRTRFSRLRGPEA